MMIDYHSLDTDQQWMWLQQVMAPLQAFAASGAIKIDRDESKVLFTGRYLERNFRVIADQGSASFEIQIKVDNSSGVLDILDSVYLDKDKTGPRPRDEWDEPSDDVTVFLAPGVYLEGAPDTVEEHKATLARYGAGLPNLLSGFVMGTDGSLRVYEDRLELTYSPSLYQFANFPGLVQGSLDFAAQLFRGFGV